jgi:hypothetical protein
MANATVSDQTRVSMTIRDDHVKLGYVGEEATRKAAKSLHRELMNRGLKPCKACASGKAKQNNIKSIVIM